MIIVFSLLRPLGQLDLHMRYLLERDLVEDMGNAVEPRPPLIVRMDDVPGGVPAARSLQHCVARPRVVVPPPECHEFHRANFPLPRRFADARRKPPFLLFLADLQPDLDQSNASINDVFFDLRAKLEKMAGLLRRGKTHYGFDAGAGIPTSVEDDHFTPPPAAVAINLHVQISLFSVPRG